jgi:Domain of unknown function (DUF4868)
MAAKFDVRTAQLIEFGVGLDDDQGERYVLVPIDDEVQAALREMVITTRDEMKEVGENPMAYDPSEKHGGKENLYLPLSDDLAANIRAIHEVNNLPNEPNALSNPASVFCYFSRMSDGKGRRLTAIRRATGFKGVLKSRFIQLLSDALKLVHEKIFKLDRDFDLLIEGADVRILRPSGFEYVGELEGEIRKAVPKNVKAISYDLPFVDFDSIEAYAAAHSRAARSLASIRGQRTKNIDQGKLKKACEHFGVKVKMLQGKLVVDPSSIMDFLYVLDRRLYQVELVKDSPESFLASSRNRVR